MRSETFGEFKVTERYDGGLTIMYGGAYLLSIVRTVSKCELCGSEKTGKFTMYRNINVWEADIETNKKGKIKIKENK